MLIENGRRLTLEMYIFTELPSCTPCGGHQVHQDYQSNQTVKKMRASASCQIPTTATKCHSLHPIWTSRMKAECVAQSLLPAVLWSPRVCY